MPPQVMHSTDYLNVYLHTFVAVFTSDIIVLDCFMGKILIIQINRRVWVCKANILNN
jgi:hypothetical protein